jgi:hypothetical protein
MSQEFTQNPKCEIVCQNAQETINILTNANREQRYGYDEHIAIDSIHAINQIAMINVQTYLKRKGRVFLECIHNKFKKEGLETFADLIFAAETETHRERSKRLESILNAFPKYFREVAENFNIDSNANNETMTHIRKADNCWSPLEEITTKELQWMLKNTLYKLDKIKLPIDVNIDSSDIDIVQFRKNCKNSKLRNIHFRLIHNDFFTYKRMFKFKMTESPNCPRCDSIESTKHLLWECQDSKEIWNLYNDLLDRCGLGEMRITKYEDLYYTEQCKILSTIKMKIIQEFIQIERPKGWTRERMEKLVTNIRNIELYNSQKHNNLNKLKKNGLTSYV